MDKLVSVIIPVYNVADYLQQIIDDLVQQELNDFEVLLIDDGSTDGSGNLCDSIASQSPLRVRVIHQKNGGLSAARNKGIEEAKGRYLTFIDPDDRITSDFLSYLLALIQKSNCSMSVCSHMIVRGGKKSLGTDNSVKYDIVPADSFIEGLLYHKRFDTSAWAKMYDEQLFGDVRFPVGTLYEDLGTTYKLAIKAEKICVGNQANYFYLIRDKSITNAKFSNNQLDFIEVTQQMKSEVDKLYPALISATAERLVFSYISTLTKTFNSQQNKDLKAVQVKLVDFIIKNKKDIINNSKSSIRDKLSVYLLMTVRLTGFRFFWKCYEGLRRI